MYCGLLHTIELIQISLWLDFNKGVKLLPHQLTFFLQMERTSTEQRHLLDALMTMEMTGLTMRFRRLYQRHWYELKAPRGSLQFDWGSPCPYIIHMACIPLM